MDQFSKSFADHWDELVGWDERVAFEMGFVSDLIKKFNGGRVLDLSLGTGFHSIELLKQGIDVTSVDISPAMIARAEENAKKHGVKLKAIRADWATLAQTVTGPFDTLICMGNSLVCEPDPKGRAEAVMNFGQVLSPNGAVIVDRRNYTALLAGEYNFNAPSPYAGKKVQIKCTRLQEDSTVFSYTFGNGDTFNLEMYPMREAELKGLFQKAGRGLVEVEIYGDQKPNNIGNHVGFYTHVFKHACG